MVFLLCFPPAYVPRDVGQSSYFVVVSMMIFVPACATVGPVVSAPNLPLVGSECVCLQCNSAFVITRGSDMPSAMDLPVRITKSRELTRNANNESGIPWQNVSNHSMYDKMPNDTTTAVQHPPKAHLGLPTTSWLRLSGNDNHSCPYVGKLSKPTSRGQFHHDLRSTTFTAREQGLFRRRVIINESSTKPRTTRHISNAHATCRNPDHT